MLTGKSQDIQRPPITVRLKELSILIHQINENTIDCSLDKQTLDQFLLDHFYCATFDILCNYKYGLARPHFDRYQENSVYF